MRRWNSRKAALFSEADDFTHTRVAVHRLRTRRRNSFPARTRIGENIRVDGISYQIVGVLKHVIKTATTTERARLRALQRHERPEEHVLPELHRHGVRRRSRQGRQGAARFAWRSITASIPKTSAPSLSSTSSPTCSTCSVITTGIKILLGFIGLLTLGIGGVGLMNIMLVSVTQRTREIGVEKALGAHRWHILFQFLAEALVITVLGGLAGSSARLSGFVVRGSLTLWSAFQENASEGDIHLNIDAAR